MLYQKIRPKSLDDMIGNTKVIEALQEMIKVSSLERPHTFLFQGPSGCGKTTLARILAKEFGCDGIDVVEINAANTRGIDSVRSVVDATAISPLYSKAKCYIFDESHQMTTQAQQCLLKVIEDCPDHTYFMFCTTEPQRIIATIRNRCAVHTVSALRKDDLYELLLTACLLEEFVINDELIYNIGSVCDGSPRQALIILEQVAKIKDPSAALEYVKNTTATTTNVLDLCRELLSKRKNRWIKCLDIYKTIESEIETTRRGILGYFKSVMLNSKTEAEAARCAVMISIFEDNIFSSGEAGLVKMIFEACFT